MYCMQASSADLMNDSRPYLSIVVVIIIIRPTARCMYSASAVLLS